MPCGCACASRPATATPRTCRPIDRAGEAVDGEVGRDASAEVVAAALEARILGAAVTLAGCMLPEGVDGLDARAEQEVAAA